MRLLGTYNNIYLCIQIGNRKFKCEIIIFQNNNNYIDTLYLLKMEMQI